MRAVYSLTRAGHKRRLTKQEIKRVTQTRQHWRIFFWRSWRDEQIDLSDYRRILRDIERGELDYHYFRTDPLSMDEWIELFCGK